MTEEQINEGWNKLLELNTSGINKAAKHIMMDCDKDGNQYPELVIPSELEVFKAVIAAILYKPYVPSTDKIEELMKLVEKED